MINISKVGPSFNPSDPNVGKSKAEKKSDKFKQMMRVAKTDTEHKKKGKESGIRKEEEESKIDKMIPKKISKNISSSSVAFKAKKIEATSPEKLEASEQENPLQEMDKASSIKENRLRPEKMKLAHKSEEENKPHAVIQGAGESAIDQEKEEEKKREVVTHSIHTKKEHNPVLSKTKKIKEATQPPALSSTPASAHLIPSASATPSSYSSLTPEMLKLFEHLASTLVVIDTNGVKETTIHLNSAEFSSKFAGVQIVIREYATAPKQFNVELLGNAQNVELFEKNIPHLMSAFKEGHYNFKIHRMEASTLSKNRPLFHRKEKVDQQKDGEI